MLDFEEEMGRPGLRMPQDLEPSSPSKNWL